VVLAVTAPLLVVTVAVIVVVWPLPATKLARPLLLIVATEVLLLVHCTTLDRFCVVPLAKVPVAVNCWLPVVSATEGVDGEIEIEDKVEALMIKEAVDEPSPLFAEIVVSPVLTAVATPPLAMVATPVFDDDHVADEVTSWVVPFTVVPVAVKFMVCPVAAKKEPGLMVRLAMELPEVKKSPHPARSVASTNKDVMKKTTLRSNCNRHLTYQLNC
jgi:hypothetical protein